MRAMISIRCFIDASVFAACVLLAVGPAYANPIDDCNHSPDVAKQIDGCTQFLEFEPDSPYVSLAYGLRGGAYQKKGDLDHAIADFSHAIEVDPGSFKIYVDRGIAYRDKGDVDQAIADFSKAIAIDSQFGDAFVNRCAAYADKGQAHLAIKDCTTAIVLNPKDAVAFNDRGVAQEKKGDLDAAIADYSKAIELDPGYGVAYANRAVVYDHKGEKESPIAITGRRYPRTRATRIARTLKLRFNGLVQVPDLSRMDAPR